MFDMLVKLYTLPPLEPELARLRALGIEIRRPMAYEKHLVTSWVATAFNRNWASECEAAFAQQPVAGFIAIESGQIVGFACHDTTCKNFFGPTGVADSQRGKGIGKGLLLACLHAMAGTGYAYAIIGGVGPAEFYRRMVGAIEIPDSTPGIYPNELGGE